MAAKDDMKSIPFFSDAPAWVKSVVYLICIPGFAMTVYSIILQIPAGPIVERAVNQALENREVRMLQALEENRAAIAIDVKESIEAEVSTRLDSIEAQLQQASDRDNELNDHIARLDERLNSVEDVAVSNQARLQELDAWTCGPIMVDRDPANDPEWCSN